MAKKKEIKNMEELLQEALIPKDEQPYEIPSNWEWVRLGSVSSQPQYGYTTKASEVGNVKYLRTTDITKENFDWDTVPFCQENPDKIKAYQLFIDDILISRSGSIGENFRVFNLSNNESVFASYMIRIRPKVSAKYLEKYFKGSYYWRQIEELGSGNTLKNISAPKIQSIKIPLPPLSEQTRIVNKLEALLSKLKEAKEKIAEVKESFELRRASILHKAFTGELTRQWREENKVNSGQLTVGSLLEGQHYPLPKTWKWAKIGQIAIINMGQSPKGESYNDKGFGVPLINGPVEFGEGAFSKTIKSKWTTKPTKMCKEDILIFCVRGSTLGRTNISGFEACIGRGVCSIEALENQWYLNYFINFKRKEFYESGTGSTFPNINKDQLESFLFPLPPLSEQQEIVTRIEALLKAEEDAKELLNMEEQIDLLEKSILSKAFRGELGTNDPSDESALELLKRVLNSPVKEQIEEKKLSQPLKKYNSILDIIQDKGCVDIVDLQKFIKMPISEIQDEVTKLLKQGKIKERRENLTLILEVNSENN